MYLRLLLEKVERSFSRRKRARTLRAGGIIVFLLVVAGLLVADYEKGRGNYTKLKDTLIAPEHHEAQYRPGGQEAIVLTRSSLGEPTPEFLSMTLLPGRGMDVLQITAQVPGRGEVKLLASEDLPEATHAMTGTGEDENGGASLTRGGPFLVPWGGRLGAGGTMVWRGRTYRVPAGATEGGLLLKAAASDVQVSPMPDGGDVTGTFVSDGWWPSKTETKISVLLASRALELYVSVKNTGAEATPVGVGWAPRFVIPSGQREQVSLRIPASMREVTGQNDGGAPTGALDAVAGTAYDFRAPGGAELGSHGLDDTFMHLSAGLEAHPTMELRDPAARFGLRMTALSPTIKAVHVFSPANGGFVTISPQMNYDDPLSRRWPADEDTGMVVLQPGMMVEWKVRLELFAILPSLVQRD